MPQIRAHVFEVISLFVFCLACLAPQVSHATDSSITFGVIGGVTGARTDSTDSVQKTGLNSDRKISWGFGIQYDMPVLPILGVSVGLLYDRRVFEIGNNTLRVQRTVPTIFLPIEARVYLGNIFSVGAGGFGALRVGDQSDQLLSGSSTAFSFSGSQRNSLEFGFTVSADVTIPIQSNFGAVVQARYLYGMSNPSNDSLYEEKINDLNLLLGLRVGF